MAIEVPDRIGIIGGTGPAGRALAARLASVGFDVTVGSRSADRAAEACEKITSKWPDERLSLRPGGNTEAAEAEMVVLATPWNAAASTAAECAGRLDGKVVISMANAISRVGDELQSITAARGSIASAVQATLAGSQVVATLHHVPARELGNLGEPVRCDVLACSDHHEAKGLAMALLSRIPGIRPVDAGSLASAGALESLTAVLVGINSRYHSRVSLSLNGLAQRSGAVTERRSPL